MKPTGIRGLLLASSGLALVLTSPALLTSPAVGQQAEECTQRLDQIEQQVQEANLESDRQQDIDEVIEGARTLAQNDDAEGCMQVVAELEDLMQTVEQTQAQAEAEEPQEQAEAEEPQEKAEAEEPQEKAEAEEPQEKADVQGGQQADQAQGQTQEQLQQVQQQLDQAQQALEQDDVQQAQQALQQAQQALQQAQAGQQLKQAEAEEPQEQAETEEQVTAETDQPTGEEPQAQAEAEEPQEQAETEEQVAAETDQPTGEEAQAEAEEPQEQAEAEEQVAAQEEQQATGEQPLEGMPATEVLGADVIATKVLGAEVINDNGETVAEVVDLVKRRQDQGMYAVLSVGGFLGIGAKEIAVPLDRFELTQDDQMLLANTTNEDLENMQEYEEAQYETVQQEGQ